VSDMATAAPSELRPSFIERLSSAIAVLGGLLSICVAILVVASVIGRRFFNAPINGDFELVQMATAISVFSFLPYCQLRRGNIVVDTFLNWLPARAIRRVDALWDLVYAGMMGLLSASLITGALEHYRTAQTTMLLQIPVWPALAICAVLCCCLVLVTLATAINLLRGRT
jgi:TRAP-type C4-dicarboxylate transport system permease small subunit